MNDELLDSYIVGFPLIIQFKNNYNIYIVNIGFFGMFGTKFFFKYFSNVKRLDAIGFSREVNLNCRTQ